MKNNANKSLTARVLLFTISTVIIGSVITGHGLYLSPYPVSTLEDNTLVDQSLDTLVSGSGIKLVPVASSPVLPINDSLDDLPWDTLFTDGVTYGNWLDMKRLDYRINATHIAFRVIFYGDFPDPSSDVFATLYLNTDDNTHTGSNTPANELSAFDYYVSTWGDIYSWNSGSFLWENTGNGAGRHVGSDYVEFLVLKDHLGKPLSIGVGVDTFNYNVDYLTTPVSHATGITFMGVTVDGNNHDWDDDLATRVTDIPDSFPHPPNVDIVDFFTADNISHLLHRFDFQGPHLQIINDTTAQLSIAPAKIFYDTDNNSLTGYRFGGVGAEYCLDVGTFQSRDWSSTEFYLSNWTGSTWNDIISPEDYYNCQVGFNVSMEVALSMEVIGYPESSIGICLVGVHYGVSDYHEHVYIPDYVTNRAPVVRVIHPNGGESFSTADGYVTIQWEMNDVDNDTLLATVYYSNDAGASWTLIMHEIAVSSYSWDISELPAGENYLVKVKATKLLDTWSDVSDNRFSIEESVESSTVTSISTEESVESSTETSFNYVFSSPGFTAGCIIAGIAILFSWKVFRKKRC